MKRIVEISIENFKGYPERECLLLPNGENLLIYGENGSGKSSLFHALRHFLNSSVDNTLPFDLNVFSGRADGKIELTFQDIDPVTSILTDGTRSTYIVRETADNSNNDQPFIKLGYRLSGFFDYSQLLRVYANKGNRPNLYDLTVDLIGDLPLTPYGINKTFRDKVNEILRLTCRSYHRSDNDYVQGKLAFDDLKNAFPHIITDLNAGLNYLMSNYFPDFNLKLTLANPSISLEESRRIIDTKISGEVYIDVMHHGTPLSNYNSRLNEARLSAIAVCLYLASLKMRNQGAEMKLLHLDDVFIGLDSANRRPILNILKNEFHEYQIIISTYDKYWFMLANEYFGDRPDWKRIELYEGETQIGGQSVPKPIFVESNSDLDKVKRYLFEPSNPDYPAAANYLRKAFEGLIAKQIYTPAVKDINLVNIPGYKIPALLSSAISLLGTLDYDSHSDSIIGMLSKLMTFLRPMLHPLSHFVPGVPVYKQELIQALHIYDELEEELRQADYPGRLKPLVSSQSKIKFIIEGVNWEQEYTLLVDNHLISYEDATGTKRFSKCPVVVCEIKEIDKTTKEEQIKKINKNSHLRKNLSYVSLEDCVNKIDRYLASDSKYADRIKKNPISDMFFLPKYDAKRKCIGYTLSLTSQLRIFTK